MQLTLEQRNFVVTNYLRPRSLTEVQQLFEQSFRDRGSPTKITMWKKAKRYKIERSRLNLNNDHSSRRRTERIQKNFSLLQEKLIMELTISARMNGLDISMSTFNRITKRDLKWHPNKMHVGKERSNYK